jgi:hypothetical protein
MGSSEFTAIEKVGWGLVGDAVRGRSVGEQAERK